MSWVSDRKNEVCVCEDFVLHLLLCLHTEASLALTCNGFPSSLKKIYYAHTASPLLSTAAKQKDCRVKSTRAEEENKKSRVIYTDLHVFEDTAFWGSEMEREGEAL